MSDAVFEQWQQIAIQIGQEIRATVNTAEMIGTSDECGYVLMFFNAEHHDGKATLVSSCTDKKQLRQLLKTALRNLDNKALVIEPGAAH